MSAKLEQVKKDIRKDKRVQRLKSVFDSERIYSIPFDEYKDELKMLHKKRTVHKLSIGDPKFGHKISDAMITETSIRHRYTELLSMCVEANQTLVSVLESLEKYLLSTYSYELKLITTKEERKNFIQSILNIFYKYTIETETMIKIIRLHIEDIDKTGYTITNLVKAYEYIAKPDRTVNI